MHIPVEERFAEWHKDPEYVAVFEADEGKWDLIWALSDARGKMTQEELAKAMGTTQTAVSFLNRPGGDGVHRCVIVTREAFRAKKRLHDTSLPGGSIKASLELRVMANRLLFLGLIVLAALLEASGDAAIRLAFGADGGIQRTAWFALGALLLFGYGFSLVSAPIDFGKLFGLYIAILFVVAQAVNVVLFKALPTLPVYLGGVLIIAGGVLVTCWKPTLR